MKFLLFLFLTTSIFAQSRILEVEEYLKKFEIDVTVKFDFFNKVAKFEDADSQNLDDMFFQCEYALIILDFMMIDRGLSFSQLNIARAIYVWRNYIIEMTRDWLIRYFSLSRKERFHLVKELEKQYRIKWNSKDNS
jgi:hypothetical protein